MPWNLCLLLTKVSRTHIGLKIIWVKAGNLLSKYFSGSYLICRHKGVLTQLVCSLCMRSFIIYCHSYLVNNNFLSKESIKLRRVVVDHWSNVHQSLFGGPDTTQSPNFSSFVIEAQVTFGMMVHWSSVGGSTSCGYLELVWPPLASFGCISNLPSFVLCLQSHLWSGLVESIGSIGFFESHHCAFSQDGACIRNLRQFGCRGLAGLTSWNSWAPQLEFCHPSSRMSQFVRKFYLGYQLWLGRGWSLVSWPSSQSRYFESYW